jgi:acetyl esterase/lipase
MARYLFCLLCLSVVSSLSLQHAHAGEGRGYERFLLRHDVNADGQVDREEFKGNPRMFERFDLNGDGIVNATEFMEFRQDRNHRRDPSSARRPKTEIPNGVKVIRDLEFARVDGVSLRLDLYLPESSSPPPLFVWIHGGGWSRGDKADINPSIIELSGDGIAVASLNYRLGGVSLHPRQVQDLKGGIRWLRANAGRYGYDPERIAVGGGSAGGHLALLLGLSGGVAALEGEIGGNLSESSRVQAIVDLYGPSELEAYTEARPKFRRRKSDELLRSASPLSYLSSDDPPVLILHGEQDQAVPVAQSRLLHERYVQVGLDSELHILAGAGHGGKPFKDSQTHRWIKEFLQKHLQVPTPHDHKTGASNPGVARINMQTAQPVQRSLDKETDRQTGLHGFHWMIGPKSGLEGSEERFERLLRVIDRNLSANPYITGVYLIYHWRLLEPQPGQLDFTRLDRVIERVRQHGRYYKLAVNPGIYSPDWLYTRGAQAFDTLGSNPARRGIYQKQIRIPLPWDAVYQSSYFDTLTKVAKRYGDDPQFRAITLTVATFMSPEWHLPRSPDDLRRWRGMGELTERLEQTWQAGMDRFAGLFPMQFLVLEASSYPLGLKELGDAVVRYGATRYAGRFAVQINQLQGKRDQAGQAGYMKLLDYKNQYGSDLLIGLQNLKGWGTEKLRKQQGSLEMSAYNFIQARGDYWELWYHDGNSLEICEFLANLQQEEAQLGLDGFKRELIKRGEYRPATKNRG